MPSIEIYRVRIDPANVERLLEVRAVAVAEFQRQMPELLHADLVRLDGDEWLGVLTWSEPVDPERIGKASGCTPTSAEMHSLIGEELGHYQGELVASSRSACAGAR